MAGNAQHGGLAGADVAGVNQFTGAGDGHTAGGFGEDALGFRQQADAGDHLLVGGILRGAAGFAHGDEGVETIGGRPDGEALHDGLRPGNRSDHVRVVLHGLGNRTAPGRLGAVDGELAVVNQPERAEFLVGLVDLGQQRAAGHAHDGVARSLPAKLLANLEAHRLGALGVIRAEVHVDEAPAVFAGDLGAQAVHLVVGAADADDVGAEHQGAEHLGGFQVGGDEHVGLQPGRGGVGGDGVSEVAGGGAGHGVEAEFLGAGKGDGNNAVLEGQGGEVHRVVLDPQVPGVQPQASGQTVRTDQRSAARLPAHRRLGAFDG